MDADIRYELRIYATATGRRPFSEWLDRLKDHRGRDLIRVRLNRVALGNLGDCRSLGGGVHELRVDFGPGYRVYFGQESDRIILLLCAGAKRTQARDIEKANTYWQDYRSRHDA